MSYFYFLKFYIVEAHGSASTQRKSTILEIQHLRRTAVYLYSMIKEILRKIIIVNIITQKRNNSKYYQKT